MELAVQEKREALEQDIASKCNALGAEREALEAKLAGWKGMRRFVHDRRDAEARIMAIDEEIAVLESGSVNRQFEKDAKAFLEASSGQADIVVKKIQRDDTFVAQKENNGRQTRKRTTARNIMVQDNTGTTTTAANGAAQSVVMDEFMAKYNDKIPTIYMTVGDTCKHCPNGKMCKFQAQMVCDGCGNAVNFIDSSSDSLAYNDEVEYSNFSYRRIAHFTEWLSNFQARENTKIPDSVMHEIMLKLKERKVDNVDSITPRLVRTILKELKLNKYYDNIVMISCRLSGKTPPRLTPREEDTLKRMFLMIQDSFEKHCPTNRKNFLSYSYCIYKFCQLLGLDRYLDYFSLLKSKQKLANQDAIFEKICRDLNWKFIPSV